jgi:uncharacterized damage-inducible protein DinB
MSIADTFVAEFNHESSGTRKLLERLPEDKLSWKPHPKSMSLGALATHIANIPHWAEIIVNESEFDMGRGDNRAPERKGRKEILELFEENIAAFQKTLSGKADQHLFQNWTLKNKGAVVLTLPRVACIRSFILSHVVHHRGQLTVYLREHDVPLPALYGPSADEGM